MELGAFLMNFVVWGRAWILRANGSISVSSSLGWESLAQFLSTFFAFALFLDALHSRGFVLVAHQFYESPCKKSNNYDDKHDSHADKDFVDLVGPLGK